ncbi:helix-turn-helix domain-containing protein [Streptomyces shaanxiensis]
MESRATDSIPWAESLTVSSIALRLGFRDASHFSRALKSRFGANPATYRRTHSAAASTHSNMLM